MDVRRLIIKLGRENEPIVENYVVAISDFYDFVANVVKKRKFKRLAFRDRERLLLDITKDIIIMKKFHDTNDCDGYTLYDSHYYSQNGNDNDSNDSGNNDDDTEESDESDSENDDDDNDNDNIEESDDEKIELGIFRTRNDGGGSGVLSIISNWSLLFKELFSWELFSWLRCWIWSKCKKH
ncbi:asb032 [Agrotis segetum nucleopolyhedrovirus B]|uniref:Asb032 n=1 Tax=Agrotis segetum nucleopolyhedrovirus B TaxID=1580580 RepID=A0A0A7KV79_9ABAC|nr:asb032 [Agrotis segetum nucleopolyhedrovirus B]AIZ48590.1 asb032 [Agrotis segetum nucleopolyhedrovirus B]